jgi:HK97 family phage major capsid protein
VSITSMQRLNATADLGKLRYVEMLEGLTFAALLSASSSSQYDVPVWRSLSNLIGAEWMEDRGLPSLMSWWGPRRSDVRALAGKRGLSVNAAASGGDLAIASAVGAIATAIRPRTVLERAGAVRVEVAGVADAVVPEWVNGSGWWVGEGEPVGAAGLTVASATATPKTAGAQVNLSRQLVLQAPQIEADVANEVRRLVGNTIEAGLLTGSGSESQPLGLLHTPGAQSVPFAGALPTYAELLEMVSAYFDADADPDRAAWLVNPSDFAQLLEVTAETGSGQYAATIDSSGRRLLGITAHLSNHVPAGRPMLLDPSTVLITYWRAPMLIRGPLSVTGSVELNILNDVDLMVRHRSQLVVGG